MQEQNFEKQVKQKMEELSLTPSEPVWKKVEEQIGSKRHRRRFFFWLPLAVLLSGAGIWLVSININTNKTVAEIRTGQSNSSNDTASTLGKNTAGEKVGKKKTSINDDKQKTILTEQVGEQKPITTENSLQPNKNSIELKTKKEFLTNVKNYKKDIDPPVQKRIILNADPVTSAEISGKNQKTSGKINNAAVAKGNGKPEIEVSNEQPGNTIAINEPASFDTISGNATKQNKLKNNDTITVSTPGLKAGEKDSLAVQKNVATIKKNFSSKWMLAVTAGIGRSGVNNGVDLFGGGAKSFETSNAFAADRNANLSQAPSNLSGAVYRPPSSQEKSSSFLLGVVVKKQVSKRSALSTGLQYNFYGTQMQVGQNIMSDTVVDQNKSVSSFYANSGSSFSNYHNKFHFISLPVSFYFQPFNKMPFDFHIGLSIQQMVETNALLYSSVSRVYYNDKSAFNKTHLFSELGFNYSFPLSKKLLFCVGPRFTYSHSRVIKESSDRHLFSYGLATQFVLSGK